MVRKIEFEKGIKAQIVISDPDGRNAMELPFHSFTDNFVKYLNKMLTSGNLSANYPKNSNNSALAANEPAQTGLTYNGIYAGIMLGTGSPTRSGAMYALGTPLTGSDISTTIPTYTITFGSGISYLTIARNITNITGSAIDVTEIAFSYYDATYYYIWSHDVFSPAYALAAGATKKFSVKIELNDTLPKPLINYMKSIHSAATFAAYDTGGSARSGISIAWNGTVIDAAANTITYGLVVGTGDSAEDIDDYALEAQINNSTLTHSACVSGTVTKNGSETYFSVQRSFTNVSGSTVTVKEIGLYMKIGSYYYMIYREVLAVPMEIANGGAETMEILIQTTFS